MMCFIELLKRVGDNSNSPVDPTVYARLRELHISRHDWRGCRGGRKLPRRGGDVSNGSDKATYDGPEVVNQSDTVSISVVAHGQSISTRVIADPHTLYTAPVSTLSQSDRHCVPRCLQHASVVQECADYGYTLFHIPRPTRRGGGVGILVKDNIYC